MHCVSTVSSTLPHFSNESQNQAFEIMIIISYDNLCFYNRFPVCFVCQVCLSRYGLFYYFFFLANLFFRLRCDTADSMKWKALFHFPTSLESLAETGEFIKFVRNELA